MSVVNSATGADSAESEQLSAEPSPFIEISRSEWAALGVNTLNPLTEIELSEIRGLGDFLDLDEVTDVYLPLSRLLNIYVAQMQALHASSENFLGQHAKRVPFVIGIAGSVAVGKSTVARLIKALLSRWEGTPRVELITTDGFLYSNAELERRGILTRKGFPESYDRMALFKFVADVKSGKEEVSAPVYSHLSYDIVEGQRVVIQSPDVLIVEGLNVLQPPSAGQETALSDFFDFKIFVDAETGNITTWFLDRFQELRASAFTNPASYFHRYAEVPFEVALETAKLIWSTINLPNLRENILPTRSRATLVLKKGPNHRVESVLLRKL
jgi:type I pantothenate kinase